VTFVPASPEDAGSVTILGQVDVSDRLTRLLGHVTVDNASLAVTGPQTDAEFAARLPFAVTGPLTSAQLVAAEPLAVTAELDTTGLATEKTLSEVALTAILERDKLATE